jgi:hypothetical protein
MGPVDFPNSTFENFNREFGVKDILQAPDLRDREAVQQYPPLCWAQCADAGAQTDDWRVVSWKYKLAYVCPKGTQLRWNLASRASGQSQDRMRTCRSGHLVIIKPHADACQGRRFRRLDPYHFSHAAPFDGRITRDFLGHFEPDLHGRAFRWWYVSFIISATFGNIHRFDYLFRPDRIPCADI